MEFIVKTFSELTTKELYDIYRVRSEIFVVEQNCVYQDIDCADLVSYHIWAQENCRIIAYCRVIPANVTFDTCSIGRVLVTDRRKGYGTELVKKAIEVAFEKFEDDTITIEAQTYARALYESCGFVQTSEPFLEDGIEHIQMKYSRQR